MVGCENPPEKLMKWKEEREAAKMRREEEVGLFILRGIIVVR